MSKQAQYEVQLKEVNTEYLKEAVERMCSELNIPILQSNKFKIGRFATLASLAIVWCGLH